MPKKKKVKIYVIRIGSSWVFEKRHFWVSKAPYGEAAHQVDIQNFGYFFYDKMLFSCSIKNFQDNNPIFAWTALVKFDKNDLICHFLDHV